MIQLVSLESEGPVVSPVHQQRADLHRAAVLQTVEELCLPDAVRRQQQQQQQQEQCLF